MLTTGEASYVCKLVESNDGQQTILISSKILPENFVLTALLLCCIQSEEISKKIKGWNEFLKKYKNLVANNAEIFLPPSGGAFGSSANQKQSANNSNFSRSNFRNSNPSKKTKVEQDGDDSGNESGDMMRIDMHDVHKAMRDMCNIGSGGCGDVFLAYIKVLTCLL